MKKTLSLLAMASSALAISTAASADDMACDVSITEMNWGSAIIVTGVAKFIMEQGYGCNVEVVPSATVTAITSLVETGEPDIATELWMNAVTPDLQAIIDAGDVIEGAPILREGGIEGWWIPTYLAEANPELATIEGILANPEAVGGVFNTCPEGWGCQISNASYIKAFDIEANGLEVFNHGSGETLSASIAEAFADQKPWLGYYWAPTSILGKYPMTLVDMGVPADADIHACASDPDCTDVAKNSWPPSPVSTLYTKAFGEAHPEIADLLNKMSYPTEVMNSLLAWQQDNGATPEEAAAYFVQNHADIWKAWLNEDATAKLEALF